jgi:hypothetical protein
MNKVNKSLMVGILLLAVVVPMTTWLAVRSQDGRSSAASESNNSVMTSGEMDINGVCGDMNGQTVAVIPDNRYACAKGAVNWMDSEASDGEYDWDCIGTQEGTVDHCKALIK